MFKNIVLAAFAVVAFAGAANATAVDVNLGSTSGTIASYGTGASAIANIALPSSTVTLSGDATIEPSGYSVSGVTTSPTGNLLNNAYVYVTGNVPSAATFTLSTHSHEFGLTWGTLDAYNTLTVTDALGHVFAITGTDIMNQLVNPVSGTTQSDVVIRDQFAAITSVVLSSSQNSFEAGNFSAVPLPPAMILFASGLIALAGFAAYKKSRA